MKFRVHRSLITVFVCLLLAACAASQTHWRIPIPKLPPTRTPTLTLTPTQTHPPTLTPTVTLTLTPTPTITRTYIATVTPRPTATPVPSATPLPRATPLPTETPAPSRPAVLFPLTDDIGRTVDWGYTGISLLTEGVTSGEPRALWACMAFQLLDRGIHRETIAFGTRRITRYYLNAAHTFDQTPQPLKLIIGAVEGEDVRLADIPAGGAAYLKYRIWPAWETFSPYVVHRDAARPLEERSKKYPDRLLTELEAVLPTLPERLIVIADHAVIVDPDDYLRLTTDMRGIAYMAARYQPFLDLAGDMEIAGPSDFALALQAYLMHGQAVAVPVEAYASDVLIFVGAP